MVQILDADDAAVLTHQTVHYGQAKSLIGTVADFIRHEGQKNVFNMFQFDAGAVVREHNPHLGLIKLSDLCRLDMDMSALIPESVDGVAEEIQKDLPDFVVTR